ncbi:hypothetical protein AXF42_Ash017014 [Apostasia shenzhenica]|uniref:Uncharacterized protein n=1 Tax=Apostasia shenzhenica TaxID=1088818 RepID=A0A2I0B7H2_9ASPA|nr:hypothetical protein AXF42_Ash017014 [Apostasia shenzhenica]
MKRGGLANRLRRPRTTFMPGGISGATASSVARFRKSCARGTGTSCELTPGISRAAAARLTSGISRAIGRTTYARDKSCDRPHDLSPG